MNDFLNFSLNSLNLLDNKIHENIKGTSVDTFIHELQDYLKLQEANSILENIPKNTNLHFAKFEGDYAICFDYSTKTIYNIPKNYIKGTEPESGDAIRLLSSNNLCVDYTGIPANANNIDEILNECNYVNTSPKLNVLPEYYKILEIGIDFAVCKNLKTNNTENIPIDEVPANAKDGDTLVYKNREFVIKK